MRGFMKKNILFICLVFACVNSNLVAKSIQPPKKAKVTAKAKAKATKKIELDPNKLVVGVGLTPQACSTTALMPETPQDKIRKHWLAMIKNSQSTKEHLKFLEDTKADIKIVPSIPGSSMSSFYALYEDGNIYVSQAMIDEVTATIKKQNWGYSEDKLLEVVAQKTADLVVHEIRHAITDKELQALLKTKFPLPLEEDELLAYHDQSRAIAEFQDPFFLTDVKTEALDQMQTQLYNAYINSSPEGIKSYIKQWNPVNSILSKQEDLLKWFSTNQKMINNGLGKLQQRLKEIRSTPSNGRAPDLVQEEANLVKTETDYIRNLETIKIAETTIADSEKFTIIQNFYKSKLKERLGK